MAVSFYFLPNLNMHNYLFNICRHIRSHRVRDHHDRDRDQIQQIHYVRHDHSFRDRDRVRVHACILNSHLERKSQSKNLILKYNHFGHHVL